MTQNPKPYATGQDFCRIFRDDMNRLYLLSFLLTADHPLAEKCFVQGLEDAKSGNPVFKEWARSWARRMIISNAIRMIDPRANRTGLNDAWIREEVDPITTTKEMAAILALPAFERFAFVMSILEGYSDRECALLLQCSTGDVIAARTRALQKVGASAELQRKVIGVDPDGAGVNFRPNLVSRLAASI